MITPKQIQSKAQRIWEQVKIFRAWILQENLFPLEIAFPKKYGRNLSENYITLRNQIQEVQQASKQVKGYGYQIEYKNVGHRQLGRQPLPDRIFFETEKDFLRFIRQEKSMQVFQDLFRQTMSSQPGLRALLVDKPFVLLHNQEIWLTLLRVCRFFLDHPMPQIYLRQVSIPGIDTKFIESNQKILHTLFMEILPETHYHKEVA